MTRTHLARFIVALVREQLDLAEISSSYRSSLGQPPFDPRLMVALLLYAYCNGIYSSRRIAKACRERVDFMSIVALDPPDFRTISDFRKRHLQALSALFVQVLKLCEKAGLVKLGHVALDGTKMKANASKHKAMSYGRMEALEAEVATWLATAALEAEARTVAEAKRKVEAEEQRRQEGRRKSGKPAASTTDQVRIVMNQWLRQYNDARPYQALSMQPPVPETIYSKRLKRGLGKGALHRTKSVLAHRDFCRIRFRGLCMIN